MIGWNSSYNWTKQEVINALVKARSERREIVRLDVEHCDYINERDILVWVREYGYLCELDGEMVVVYLV